LFRPDITDRDPFRCFKTSRETIRRAVMVSVRFPLSRRHVGDPLHDRGIDIGKAVRYRWLRFGPLFAAETRKGRIAGMKSSRGHCDPDEIFVKISGERHYPWRAVDHEGEVPESFVPTTRDKTAALKFLNKAMRRHGRPELVVTDTLRSCGAALKDSGRRRPGAVRRVNRR